MKLIFRHLSILLFCLIIERSQQQDVQPFPMNHPEGFQPAIINSLVPAVNNNHPRRNPCFVDPAHYNPVRFGPCKPHGTRRGHLLENSSNNLPSSLRDMNNAVDAYANLFRGIDPNFDDREFPVQQDDEVPSQYV